MLVLQDNSCVSSITVWSKTFITIKNKTTPFIFYTPSSQMDPQAHGTTIQCTKKLFYLCWLLVASGTWCSSCFNWGCVKHCRAVGRFYLEFSQDVCWCCFFISVKGLGTSRSRLILPQPPLGRRASCSAFCSWHFLSWKYIHYWQISKISIVLVPFSSWHVGGYE